MNYVEYLDIFGAVAKEIPCVKGEGAPTAETGGAVGLLYMDTLTGDVYKCTAVTDYGYTWERLVGEDFYGVNVKNYGAKGDGKTDDTDAIRAARDAAVSEKKSLYFPAGTYMVHGSIELWSDCEIFGEGSRSVVKKIPAITEVLKPEGTTGSFYQNQTTFTVADGSQYTVGYDCYVGVHGVNFDTGLYGKIESIEGNNVTIKAYPKQLIDNAILTGLFDPWWVNTSTRKAILTTSFPVFCTYKYKSDKSINNLHDVYIHDITIDGNRQDGEADAFHISLIHFDGTGFVDLPIGSSGISVRERISENPHENIRLENLNLYNSPADGISVQGSKNVCITNCVTENSGVNGVHIGIGSTNVSVIGCKLNADFCGYFDCAGVSSATVSNNHFEKCSYGIGGLDSMTRGLTINGNTFRGCGVGVHGGATPYPQYMRDDDPTFITYMGSPRTGITICNNTFYGDELTGIGISLVISKYTTVCGNTFRDLATAIETGVTHSARIADNIIKDCRAVLSMIKGVSDFTAWGTDTHNSAFVGNVVHAEISGASAAVSIANAHNMLVTGNIVTGTGAALSAEAATTTGVILENNIVAE